MNSFMLSKIVVAENRQRKTFDNAKIKELGESILNVGLLHPIVVRVVDGEAHLVAGERRLRALQLINQEHFCNGQLIPQGFALCTLTTELDALELREAELEENIRRVDLTWQERAAAINALADLRRDQKPTISKKEIAQEIQDLTGGQTIQQGYTELARATFVAQHMHDPKVAGARTLKEAYSIATRQDEALFMNALGEAVGETTSHHQIIVGDCIAEMAQLTPGSVDVIMTDPPYGMGADEFGKAGPVHQYADSKDNALFIAQQIFQQGVVVCKEQAHLYMFCDIDNFHELRSFATLAGWTPWRTPIIWDKGSQQGHNPIPDQGIRRCYETILYCYRGGKPGVVFSMDVIRGIPSISSPLHPAEKPSELYRHILGRSVRPGDTVLDPCCGVGGIFIAANALKVKAIGIELDAGYAAVAASRRGEGVNSGCPPEGAQNDRTLEDL